ncbi:hypothetical protein MVEN_00862400 [Mycena venus]|uniref:Uncharacterized protein n=1 Tax=Mycena venus TaxID=2733690 RepID=A0A8H6YBS4_9AGAR|nr:hypothetical protein MVEN_00862400 [Mycena venus]
MNCQFWFGPNNSYFCVTAGGWVCSENTLPAAVFRVFIDENHAQAMDTPRDVAFAVDEGSYMVRWTAKNGKNYKKIPVGSNYARLGRFVDSNNPTLTTFGPGFSYFSFSHTGCSWQNIPPALEENIQNCMNVRRPACVALGVEGTYIVIFDDGTVTFDLQGKYPEAETIIQNRAKRNGLGYIALSPFRAGHYYAVCRNGSSLWNLPASWKEQVTAVSKGIRAVGQKTASSASSRKTQKVGWKEGLEMGVTVLNVAQAVMSLANT